MARLLKVNDQMTPKAYASPKVMTLPRLTTIVNIWQAKHQVHDAMAGSELLVRLAKPVGEYAVFGHTHQHAGGTDHRCVDCA